MSKDFGQLVPVKANEQFCVNARQLHEALQNGKMFSHWIKHRIEKYGFIEGADFLPKKAESSGGRNPIEYELTIGMAKELCMIENNEIGKEIRKHFIRCEEQLKQQQAQLTEEEQEEIQMYRLCQKYIKAVDEKNYAKAEMMVAFKQRDEIGNNFGAGPEYYKVSEIPWLYAIFKRGFEKYLHKRIGQMLAGICKAQGTEPKKCQHENGGHWWRAYPKQVIELLHQQLLMDQELLKNLRISKRKSMPQNKCRCLNFR